MKNQKHCFALDLKNDETLINEYIEHHKNVWPEIIESIKGSHIENLDIYLLKNRLFMIMETSSCMSVFGSQLSFFLAFSGEPNNSLTSVCL